MKLIRVAFALSIFALAPGLSRAAETKKNEPAKATDVTAPELRGVLSLGHEMLFSISSSGGAHSAWLKVGESFDGWKLQEYKTASETLVVANGVQSVNLHLANSKVGSADVASARASAEDIIRKMHLDEMFAQVIQQQRQAMMTMTKQMMARNGATGASQEKAAEFQGKVMDALWGEMKPEQLKDDMVKIYSDTFTATELQGLSDFYSTSAGQAMIAKQPEVQQKMMAVMMPRMMAAMPKIQQMGRDFAAQNAASAAVGAAPNVSIPASATKTASPETSTAPKIP